MPEIPVKCPHIIVSAGMRYFFNREFRAFKIVRCLSDPVPI